MEDIDTCVHQRQLLPLTQFVELTMLAHTHGPLSIRLGRNIDVRFLNQHGLVLRFVLSVRLRVYQLLNWLERVGWIKSGVIVVCRSDVDKMWGRGAVM